MSARDGDAPFRALCAAGAAWLGHPSPGWPETVDWRRSARLARVHNLGPLLHRLAEERRLPVAEIPPEVLAAWEAAYYRNYLFNQRALELLDRLCRAARAGSLPVAVFKGPATLARVYRDPALRVMVDLDLLVRRRDLEPLTRIAAGLGFRARADPHPIHATAVHPGLGLGLELHFDLYDFLLRRAELAERILSSPVELAIEEHRFPAAPHGLALVLEVAHLVQHDFELGLRNWLDLAALLRDAGAADRELLREALAIHGIAEELLLAIEITDSLFALPSPAAASPSGYPPAERRRLIRRLTRLEQPADRGALQELARRRGPAAKLAYLGRRLLPTGSRWRALRVYRSAPLALAAIGRQTLRAGARELAR